jgi:hypothetical protein
VFDFWCLLCLFLIDTCFFVPRLDRRSPSFDLPLIIGNFYYSIPNLENLQNSFSWTFILFLYFLSFSSFSNIRLLFLAFPYLLSLSVSSKHLSFAFGVGCDPSQGFFFEKNILLGSKWDCKGYIFRKWRDNKDYPFSFQARSIRTDKFWPRLV